MNQPARRIYLLDRKGSPSGPFSREVLIARLRGGQLSRPEPAWAPGMSRWGRLEDVLFSHCRGIDRPGYLGLTIALLAYLAVMLVILDGVKINPLRMLEVMADGRMPKFYHMAAYSAVSAFGWLLAGLFLVPRLAHLGMRRRWALLGALPVLGWPLRVLGLLAPRGYAESRGLPGWLCRKPPVEEPRPMPGEEDQPAQPRPPSPPPGRLGPSLPAKLFRVLKWTAIGAGGTALLIYGSFYLAMYGYTVKYFGHEDLGSGSVPVPTERSLEWAERSDYLDATFRQLLGNSGIDGFIAKLYLGESIDEVNRSLQAMEVKNHVGTGGNWDFRLCELSLLLYSYGHRPELLYPETVEHIVQVLMTEKGGEPLIWTPNFYGLPLQDSENHVLMTESSRYLTNQWLAEQGDSDPKYDNRANGLEAWLLRHLKSLETGSIHEYNSIPYAGYTLRALLNLESFASEPVSAAARRILDRMNWEYAVGSLSLRQFPPFSRSWNRAGETNLEFNYEMALMQGWMSLHPEVKFQEPARIPYHTFWPALTRYRLPDTVAEWLLAKPVDYLVRIGHGSDASAEIYSGGPGYLISSGGVATDLIRETVARPTVLLLEDGVRSLEGLLHIAGPGDSFRKWNNTGVHRRFAVAAGPVRIPSGWQPSAAAGHWSVYLLSGQRIGVYSSASLGIFCLLPEGEADALAAKLAALNPEPESLQHTFHHPEGAVIEYDPRARKNLWVIRAVNGEPVDRRYESWPLMSGEGFPDNL